MHPTRVIFKLVCCAAFPARMLLLLISNLLAASGDELQFVQAIVRHGDRAPSMLWNAHHIAHFPHGLSQLTDVGYAQSKSLGNWLRNRYAGNILKNIGKNEIYIRSSDKDRCIETAMGISEGLMPNRRIAIHTAGDHKNDLLLKPNSMKCEQLDKRVAIERSNWNRLISNETNMEMFSILSKEARTAIDATNIEDAYNVMSRLKANGVSQPNVDGYLQIVTELKRQSRMMAFNDEWKSKLRTGFLLAKTTRNMLEGKRKLVVYTTHDATITSMLYSLNVSDHQLPIYTATILFEVYKTANGTRYLKVFYKNSLDPEQPTLILRPCGSEKCDLNAFADKFAERMVHTRQEMMQLCGNEQQDHIVQTGVFKNQALIGIASLVDYLLLSSKVTK